MNIIEELHKVVDEINEKIKSGFRCDTPEYWIQERAERLQSIIDSMKAQEPVAWMRYGSDGNPIDVLIGDEPMEFIHGRNAPLYAAPQVPEGMVMVPREPGIDLVEAFYRAYERPLSPDRWESRFDNAWEAMIDAAEKRE